MSRFADLLLSPLPLRTIAMRKLIRRWPVLSYPDRLRLGAVERPWYGWTVYNAALQARALGIKEIAALEFGVAGGQGLLCLENHVEEVERTTGIKISVWGFDAGSGLPDTKDYRDLLYVWPPNSFEMDFKELSKRLRRERLVIGDVRETIVDFMQRPEIPTVGAVMFDLDLYTSTAAALAILEVPDERILPRALCYFDDIMGGPENLCCDQTGERLAIVEFNQRNHGRIHLGLANGFKGRSPEYWHDQVYACHRFAHPQYNTCLSSERHLLALNE
jgi:hypothetical protein